MKHIHFYLIITTLIFMVLSCGPCGLIQVQDAGQPITQIQTVALVPTFTNIPVSTATFVPPTLTVAPQPTQTPIPLPTDTLVPQPTNTSVSLPQPQQFSGRGQQVSQKFSLSPGLVKFQMLHAGTGNFAIWLLDDTGNKIDLLVNEIGSFQGAIAIGIERSGIYLFDVDADGNWTITVSYPDPASATVMSIVSGHGKQVSPVLSLQKGLLTFQMNHNGQGNFAIWLYSLSGQRIDLLVNEIGSFDGSTAVGIKQSGAYMLDIEADGEWKIDLSQ